MERGGLVGPVRSILRRRAGVFELTITWDPWPIEATQAT